MATKNTKRTPNERKEEILNNSEGKARQSSARQKIRYRENPSPEQFEKKTRSSERIS